MRVRIPSTVTYMILSDALKAAKQVLQAKLARNNFTLGVEDRSMQLGCDEGENAFALKYVADDRCSISPELDAFE